MIYSEIQRFRQLQLWAILIIVWTSVIGTFGSGVYRQLVQDIPFGNSPVNDSGLLVSFILVFVLVSALIVLFIKAKLITQIDKKFISYKFYPLHKSFRKIAWKSISKCEFVTYQPRSQFGGWGIREGKNGKAYNVSGNRGLQIVLRTGERILIGTTKPNELSMAIDDFIKLLKVKK
jgi:hypothetical protein